MRFKVIGLGEVLWDMLPTGAQLGGAPANFCWHCRELGAEVQVITRVGNDALGRQVLERLGQSTVGGTVQVDDQLPTGTAGVVLDRDGSPKFTITEGVAWDALALTDEALEAARNAHAVCFGTLAQRTPSAASVIQQLLAATALDSLRIFDINLRQEYYSPEILERSLKVANVLKLNDQELTILSPIFDLKGTVNQRIEQLAQRFELRLVALTRAERGSALYQPSSWSDLPGRHIEVVDTVGAGDAFTAGLVMGLLHQFPLDDIHRGAAEIAAFVCSCRGATPSLPIHLRSLFDKQLKVSTA